MYNEVKKWNTQDESFKIYARSNVQSARIEPKRLKILSLLSFKKKSVYLFNKLI